jgi:hypothetical protein
MGAGGLGGDGDAHNTDVSGGGGYTTVAASSATKQSPEMLAAQRARQQQLLETSATAAAAVQRQQQWAADEESAEDDRRRQRQQEEDVQLTRDDIADLHQSASILLLEAAKSDSAGGVHLPAVGEVLPPSPSHANGADGATPGGFKRRSERRTPGYSSSAGNAASPPGSNSASRAGLVVNVLAPAAEAALLEARKSQKALQSTAAVKGGGHCRGRSSSSGGSLDQRPLAAVEHIAAPDAGLIEPIESQRTREGEHHLARKDSGEVVRLSSLHRLHTQSHTQYARADRTLSLHAHLRIAQLQHRAIASSSTSVYTIALAFKLRFDCDDAEFV